MESMPMKLCTDFMQSSVNMFLHFERCDSGLERYGSIVKTSMMKFALGDLLWMIFMPKLWLF
jgi:hypothetical protein